jgi:hypothetical protein
MTEGYSSQRGRDFFAEMASVASLGGDPAALQLAGCGYVQPFRVVETSLLDAIAAEANAVRTATLAEMTAGPHLGRAGWSWIKGGHVAASVLRTLATSRSILDRVERVLGPDLLLWGSEVVARGPGQFHRWHADVEHLEWPGVTVWIGLANSLKASLRIIPGSHLFPTCPQEHVGQGDWSAVFDREVLDVARVYDPQAEIVTPTVRDGEALLFAGPLWHSSLNTTRSKRTAIILQYCSPAQKVQIPLNYDPPVRWAQGAPPCLLVRGRDRFRLNRVIELPVASER